MVNLYLERKMYLFGAWSALEKVGYDLLDAADRRLLCDGSVRVLSAKDDFGRPILWLNHLGWNRRSQKSTMRAIWFAAHSILNTADDDDSSSRTRGVVILIVSPRTFSLEKHFNRKLYNSIIRTIRDVLPLKISAVHMIVRSREMDLVLPYLLHTMGATIRSRLVFHRGNLIQINESLAEYGISKLPATLNGEVKDDLYCCCQHQHTAVHHAKRRKRLLARRSASLSRSSSGPY